MPKTKKQKQEEAEARRALYLARTPSQQMNLVRQRPGDALAERERLIDKIEKGDPHV